MARYVLEGIWSGYRSSQSRPCHREIITRKSTLEYFSKLAGVRFTDGTTMDFSTRKCLPRERVKLIHGYDDLIWKIRLKKMTGMVNVMDV